MNRNKEQIARLEKWRDACTSNHNGTHAKWKLFRTVAGALAATTPEAADRSVGGGLLSLFVRDTVQADPEYVADVLSDAIREATTNDK